MINHDVAVEVKATRNVQKTDLKGLRALGEEIKLKKQIVVCRETQPRNMDGIEVLPYDQFIDRLWKNELS